MNLIQSWKESLQLLEVKNLKPFLLVNFKTVLDLYKEINRPLASRGNWTLLVAIVVLIGLTNILKMFHLFRLEAIIQNGMLHFLFFMFCLAMRPSIAMKGLEYFRSYLERFWIVLVVTIVLGITQIYIIPLTFIVYMLFLFFAFDTQGTLNGLLLSLRNGFMMVLYNLPIFLILELLIRLINYILFYLVGFALGNFGGLTLVVILYILIVPIEVAFISNLYIKFVHSQSSLYFSQPK